LTRPAPPAILIPGGQVKERPAGEETIVAASFEPAEESEVVGAEAAQERARKQEHLSVLVLTVLVIVAAFLLQVAPDGDRVYLRDTPSLKVPPLCFSRAVLGVPCPGCGLTRSFIYLAQGNFSASWQAHRLGWLIAALVLVQVPYRLAEIAWPGRWQPGRILTRVALIVLLVLFLVTWLARFAP
jgi:hypothetical protein